MVKPQHQKTLDVSNQPTNRCRNRTEPTSQALAKLEKKSRVRPPASTPCEVKTTGVDGEPIASMDVWYIWIYLTT